MRAALRTMRTRDRSLRLGQTVGVVPTGISAGVVTTNTIFQILPLRDGGIVYCAADPAFGAIDTNGRRVLFNSSTTADFRDLGEGFFLAPDGTGVGFAYQRFGILPARFSIVDRKLDSAPVGGLNWRPPATESPGMEITGMDSYAPKLNGTQLSPRAV